MSHTALLFSGQGAQAIGMGKDLAAHFPTAAALFQQADETLGIKLSQIMFEGPADTLTQTSICQPALYAHGLACLALLKEALPNFSFQAVAGLSLGEFTAHAAAGTFNFETGLKIVTQRGQFMQEACEATSGAMAAIIGANEEQVRSLAVAADVDVANFNAPGQIVISGEKTKIAHAISIAKEHGARKAIELTVAGAFHSRLMQPALERLQEVLTNNSLQLPSVPVIANITARPTDSVEQIRTTLANQVTGSVCWTETIEYLIDEIGCTRFLELGPGGVIAGLVSRIRKGTEVISVSDATTLKKAIELLQ